jgi:hypothetical protein
VTSAFTTSIFALFRARGCASATAGAATSSPNVALGAWPSYYASTARTCSGTGATAPSTNLASWNLPSAHRRTECDAGNEEVEMQS